MKISGAISLGEIDIDFTVELTPQELMGIAEVGRNVVAMLPEMVDDLAEARRRLEEHEADFAEDEEECGGCSECGHAEECFGEEGENPIIGVQQIPMDSELGQILGKLLGNLMKRDSK